MMEVLSIVVEQIWREFCRKLESDSFADSDFSSENVSFLRPFFCGVSREARRNSFLHGAATFLSCETKNCVMVSCPDGEYRFDFCGDDRRWCLQFIECITLPVASITEMPYDNFLPLPDKEAWIRYEKVISKQVYLFCKAKELLGFDEALKWFQDGAGELLGTKSWVPFYDDRKAFILYSAWMENRIYGEKICLERFSDDMCRLRFKGHLWFKVYWMTGHIRTLLSLE